MTATVSSGMSHAGKWPLGANQCKSADGKAALARAACCGRQSRSCLPHPITIRPVDCAAGPVCSGPPARSSTSASNVGVLLRLVSSVATTCELSAHGRTDSWASNAERDAAFWLGLIGVPVLAGSAGYAMSEAMGWKWGLERTANDARGFYGVITVSVLAALAIQYSPISPMRALFWSAVINGLVAVPLMVVLILLVSRTKVMGAFTASKPIIILGWMTVALMAVAGVAMFLPGI